MSKLERERMGSRGRRDEMDEGEDEGKIAKRGLRREGCKNNRYKCGTLDKHSLYGLRSD